MEMNDITSQAMQAAQQDGGVTTPPVRKRSRKRSITIFIVVSLLNVALLVLLWTQLLTPAKQSSNTASNTGDATTLTGDIPSFPLIGKPMPDFTLSALNGSTHTIRLADFKGQPIILNFWASWCDPCNQEAPFLEQTWPKLKAQGVALIGVDGQELKVANGQAFLQKYHVNYLNVEDTIDGTAEISYGVTAFPETVFINRQGIVVAKWASVLTTQGLQMEMAKMLK